LQATKIRNSTGVNFLTTADYSLIRRLHLADIIHSNTIHFIMGPSFLEGGPIMCWSCPSVCLSRAST